MNSILATLWAWTKARLGGDREQRKPSRGERAFARMLPGNSFGLPGGWSQDRRQQVLQYRHWTYIAVRAIAEEIAGQPPLVAYRRSAAEVSAKGLHAKVLPRYRRKSAMARIASHEELEPADSSHPLARLLANPNEPDTSETFWQRTVINAELTGNAYWWAIENKAGRPCELWVLPSHWVWPSPNRRSESLVDFYDIRPYGASSSGSLTLSADEVIHIPYPGAITPFDGWSPLSAGAEWVDIASSMDASRWASFKQGIWPGLILELAADMEDPDDATIARLYARLEQRFRGELNTDKPMILSPGAKVADRTRPPRDMEFVQGSDQMRDWVLALHRVSKTIAGITEEVNRASMETAAANFARWTIRPKVRLIDGIATEKLAKRFDEALVIYHEDPAAPDPAAETERITKLVGAGIMTPNEARAELGMPPLPEGGDEVQGKGQLQQPGEAPGKVPTAAENKPEESQVTEEPDQDDHPRPQSRLKRHHLNGKPQRGA